MADTSCQDACEAAYQAQVQRLNAVLMENLVEAKTDEDRQEAKAAFARGMALAKEVRETCLGQC